jgi:hypothetical protein
MVSLGLTASMMLAACASGSRSEGTTSSTSTQAAAPTAPAASEGCVVHDYLVHLRQQGRSDDPTEGWSRDPLRRDHVSGLRHKELVPMPR